MVRKTLRKGSKVSILRGIYRGEQGKVTRTIEGGYYKVKLKSTMVTFPRQNLRKLPS